MREWPYTALRYPSGFALGTSLGPREISLSSLGMYQEIHTLSALNIDSVKINTSLLMMREWKMLHLTNQLIENVYGTNQKYCRKTNTVQQN